MKSRQPQEDFWRETDGSPKGEGYHHNCNAVTGTATDRAMADLLKVAQ